MVVDPGLVTPGLVASLRDRLEDMTAQLADLVSHESPSEDRGLLAQCAARVGALGAELLGADPDLVEVDGRRHLVWRFGTGPGVVLVGHYDTVWPAGTLSRWPFSVDATGLATGPGVFDMKAGIVQMFHALSVLDLAALTTEGGAGSTGPGVAVVLTADEELGSQTSRRLIEETARGGRAALVLEPSLAGALKVARKGTSMYQVHALGRSSHAGLEPEKGVNATIELAHQVLAVADLGRSERGTTVTPTVISGGTTTNTVPGEAVLHVDARAEDPAEQERVDAALRGLTAVLAGSELRVEGGINRPPLNASFSEGLMDLASDVAGRLGLEPLSGVAVGGASDGNFTAGVGVPTLDGLGAVGDAAHAEGEWTRLDAMPERAALVAGLVAELLSRG
jgi:glutamate carboxypeptidase